MLLNIRDKPAFVKDMEHHLRNLTKGELVAVGYIIDCPRSQVNLQLIPIIDFIGITYQHGEPEVYGIPEEYPGY